MLTTLGAGVSAALLVGAPGGMVATVLPVGAGLYLVGEELLVHAHERRETAFGSALLCVGFLIYLVIEDIV